MTERWRDRDIVVVYGGDGNEREVSLATGRALAQALDEAGVAPRRVDLRRDALLDLLAERPDAVVNAMHGPAGEGGPLQGALEWAGIPYTGSGVLASALAMDKVAAKAVFSAHDIPTPASWVVTGQEDDAEIALRLPAVVKPVADGSSVGIALARDVNQWRRACEDAAERSGAVFAERYVEGRELTVALLDGEVLGVIEIRPREGFYDFAAKYERDDTEYLFPAPLDEDVTSKVSETASAAYSALGCRGVARVDLLLEEGGQPWVLEVNTIPGMTATSLVPKIAEGRGIALPDLALRMLAGATTDRQWARGSR